MFETLVGRVPDDWETLNLGEVCARGGGDIQTGPFGSQLHASDYVPVGIPSVMPQNIGDNVILEEDIARISLEDARRLKRYLLAPGDIVYSRRGDVERRALVRAEHDGWLCGTGCLRVRPGAAADSRFLAYYLGEPKVRAHIIRNSVGATMRNLNTQILSAVPIVLPPIPLQRAIGDMLGVLDDKIAVNERISITAIGLLGANFSILVRESHRVIDLGEIIDLHYGKALTENYRTPGPIPVFGSNGISGWNNVSLVEGPGVIVGRKGANAGSVSWSQEAFWPIDTSFYAEPVAPEVSMQVVFFLLETLGLPRLLGDSAIPGLNRSTALACKARLPDAKRMLEFTQTARPTLEMVTRRKAENRALAELRDALLPRLVSGQLWIKDAEMAVDEAV